MNCDRCGRKMTAGQKLFEVFIFCEDCHKKVMFELKGEDYGEM